MESWNIGILKKVGMPLFHYSSIPKVGHKLSYIIGFIVLFIIGFYAAHLLDKDDNTVKSSQILLGTVVEIQIREMDKQTAEKAITSAFNEISRIDKLFSTYDEESPVWKINHGSDSIISVDADIYQLIKQCDSFWQITSGAFDVTLESLISAWGFDNEVPSIPAENERRNALIKSGWKNISLKESNNEITRDNEVKFNFGAVIPGYAADKVIELLKQSGITNALVNAGGEIKGIGDDWVIGIQHPRLPGQIIAKIKLSGKAVATSGDYEQYFEENGKRYHHILNAETGFPANECQSVTIIANDAATADALSTGIFVLGPEKGLELIEKLDGTEAMIVDIEGKIHQSSGFNKYILR